MSLVLPPGTEASGIGDWGRSSARKKTLTLTGRKARPLRCYFGRKGEMRRVGVPGGGSPDVMARASEVSPESTFRELDDFFLQTQTRIWLGEVLRMRFDVETPIADLLADGELLFQVSKVVRQMLLNKHSDAVDSKLFIHERTSLSKSDGKYLAYPKVDSFLKICKILGLTGIDLFSPSDVVDKRDIRRVCMCIRSLSKKARSKKLNVPDFDIVTYKIAMSTDIVGGIRRILEQSSSSSPISDSYREISRSYIQSQEYFLESDGAESCFSELASETRSANDSFHGAAIFDLDQEDFTLDCIGEDNLLGLHPYLVQEDLSQFEQNKKSSFLESTDSTCRSIANTSKSDIVNSGVDCCKNLFLPDVKSLFEAEAQIGEKENQCDNGSAPKNYSSGSSSWASLAADDEIIETIIDACHATDENVSCIGGKHDDMEIRSGIQHKEHGDDSPLSIVQSLNGMPICENNMMDEQENISLILSDISEGLHENSINDHSEATTSSCIDGYALPDYSTKDKQFNLDCSYQKSDDRGILVSEVGGTAVCLPTRDEDCHVQGSRCPEIKAVDQVIYLDCERFSIPNTELFPDNRSVISSDEKFQSSDDIFSAPAICSYEADANLSSVPDDSSEEHVEKGIREEREIRCVFVGSALETCERTLPSESVNAFQDARIFGGSYPRDKSTCAHLAAEKGPLIGMTIPEKMDLFSRVLARDEKQQIRDEDDIHDIHPMSLHNVDDSGRSTCSEESSEQIVLPLEEQMKDSHSHHTQPETSQTMMNNIEGSRHVGNYDPCKSINRRSRSHGAELTNNPRVVHSYDHTCAPQEFNEECICANSFVSCKEISEVQYQVHLVDEVGTFTGHTAHDDTEEGQKVKDTEEHEKNAPTTSATGGKSMERNTGRKMIKSIAGSITVVCAMLVFLHMRGKKHKEKSSQTAVPQPAKKISDKVFTRNKVEKTGKSDRVYPGEKFKF